ncbi:MAG: hypothetical protein LBE36_12330 [Flavobacteriaceae bacterium]|jgi:hypothetical protein|nr:hypothetical protein [Flavobacteriaceae bacterium]
MKKSLLQEIGRHKKELFPILFSNVYPVDITRAIRDRPFRTATSSFHQSEIFCLRIYKDGINLFTE